jgi:hypothetical protein
MDGWMDGEGGNGDGGRGMDDDGQDEDIKVDGREKANKISPWLASA